MYIARTAVLRNAEPQYRWRIIFVSGVLLSMIHALLLPRLNLGAFTPDIFSVVALYFGMFANRKGRYLPSLALGLMRDFFSLGLLGSYAVLFSLLHKFAAKARLKLDPSRLSNVFILAVIGTFLVNFGYHVMLALSGSGIGWTASITRCGCTAIASGLPAVLMFPIFHSLLARAGVARVSGGYLNF